MFLHGLLFFFGADDMARSSVPDISEKTLRVGIGLAEIVAITSVFIGIVLIFSRDIETSSAKIVLTGTGIGYLFLIAGVVKHMIDFQDMVKGPVCYDLASIVFDAYWQLTHDQQMSLIKDYYQQLQQAEILSVEIDIDEFQRWVSITAMQRLLKILGIFCRLTLRDGKAQYLSDLPLVMKHVDDLVNHDLALWPEGFSAFWSHTIKPALEKKLLDERCK